MNMELVAVAGASAGGCVLAVWAVVRPELNSLRSEMRKLAERLHTERGAL